MAVIFFWLASQERFVPDDAIIRFVLALCGFLSLFGIYIGIRYPITKTDRRIRIYDQVAPILGNLEIIKTLLKSSECVGMLSIGGEGVGIRSYMLQLWCAEGINQVNLGFFEDVEVYIDPKSKLPVAVDTINRTYWVERVLNKETLAS
jgi:hypothetical protein